MTCPFWLVGLLALACSNAGQVRNDPAVGGDSGSGHAGVGGTQLTAGGGQAGAGGAQAGAGSGGVAGGEAGTDAGGAPPAERCASATPEACWRGLYLSPYTDHSGQVTFEGDTAQHLYILDDPQKSDQVLAFIEAQGIDSLSFYDLATLLDDVELKAKLASFVQAARARGVIEVNAIGSTYLPAWDAIAAAQLESQLFDGVVTEIEFWNASATFEEFQSVAAHVRGLSMKTPDGRDMPLAAYIGWPTPEQVSALVPLVDRLFVHTYVTSADLAYGYGQERFAAFAALEPALEVRPIFSAEGQAWSAGDEHFMGEWLATHSLAEAEASFLTSWEAEEAAMPVLGGFQYYDYFYLERYLE